MKTVALAIFGIIAVGFPASAQTSKQTKIDQILELTNAQAVMDQMFAQIKTMAASQMRPDATAEERTKSQAIQDKMMDLIKTRMSWDILRPQYARIYDATFTDDEIDGMLAFYQSKAGRAFIEKTPLLLSKTMAVGLKQMADIMPEIQRIAREAGAK